MTLLNNLYIGPAGWSYPDWKGVVYPTRGKADELDILSAMFDAIEVNSSFYRPPTPAMTENWLRRVERNHRFLFTLKLYRRFTHERDKLEPHEEALFKEGIRPLVDAEKLGCLLIQFPYSFRNTPENKEILVDLFARFHEYPLALEIRHQSWNTPVVMESLLRHKVGFCNIDQPAVSRSIDLTNHVTAPVAYLRLHGRNRRQWFARDAGAERYNYLYSGQELKEFLQVIERLAGSSEKAFIILNNHAAGKAVANALQLTLFTTGAMPAVPEELIQSYPFLAERPPRAAKPAPGGLGPFLDR